MDNRSRNVMRYAVGRLPDIKLVIPHKKGNFFKRFNKVDKRYYVVSRLIWFSLQLIKAILTDIREPA